MKRLQTINSFDGAKIVDIKDKSLYTVINAPYVIDDSKFSPISQALKNIQGNTLTDEQMNQSYDFIDGKDNGMALPISRGRFADSIEVLTEMRETNKNLKNSFYEFVDDEKRKAAQKKRLDVLNSVRETTSNPTE